MTDQDDKYIHYRELQTMFDVYQKPKLIRILDEQNISYFKDSNGQPFTLRVAIENALVNRAATDEPD